MRIQKYFSQQKILSRRETEEHIRLGKIKVNGEIVKDLGRQIDPTRDKVEIIGEIREKITVLFHKPRSISSSKVKSEGKNIFDLVPQFNNLNTIGRLDKESEGLILLTNDGILAKIVVGQEHLVEKEYLVEVKEKLNQSKMNALSKGMILEDGPTLPTKAKLLDEHIFLITLREGKNHQIRRMTNKLRLTIKTLRRIRIGHLSIDDLPIGDFRHLAKEEVEKVKILAKA